jgi:hypothetical protein
MFLRLLEKELSSALSYALPNSLLRVIFEFCFCAFRGKLLESIPCSPTIQLHVQGDAKILARGIDQSISLYDFDLKSVLVEYECQPTFPVNGNNKNGKQTWQNGDFITLSKKKITVHKTNNKQHCLLLPYTSASTLPDGRLVIALASCLELWG